MGWYDPVTGEIKRTGEMITPRAAYTATLLTNGQVLLAGGGNPNLTSVELYNPNGGPPIVMTNLARLPSGAFQFSFTNTPEIDFGILATTNISLPISNWTEIATIPDLGVGQYQFTDYNATNYPQRFYRVSSP
jgi:hypothetical protein